MNHYAIKDFMMYFQDSYLLHPTTGDVVQVYSSTEDGLVLVNPGRQKLTLQELDWKHVTTPTLGYRSLLKGQVLYYITRRAGRRTRKGVTPEAIIINIPSIVRELGSVVGTSSVLDKHAFLTENMAKVIFKPEFVPLSEAIEQLKTKKQALGFALSNNWAVTLGLYKDEMFLLHFKGIRVGGSVDGVKWKFYNKDGERLFNDSGLKGE